MIILALATTLPGMSVLDPTLVPGYQPGLPPEAGYSNPSALAGALGPATRTLVYETLSQTAKNRPYFVLDGETDPVFQASQDILENPQKVLEGYMRGTIPLSRYTYETCVESKPPKSFTCHRLLTPPTIHVDPALYSHYWCSAGNHTPDDPRCRAKAYYPTARLYKAEKIHESAEAWTSNCAEGEAKYPPGFCHKHQERCVDGPGSRTVMGTIGPARTPVSRSLYRPCWKYEVTYQCAYPSANTCAPLRQKSCEQTYSTCRNVLGDTCVEWSQTYRCPPPQDARPILKTTPLRLSWNDPPPMESGPSDLNEALAQLSIYREMQGDIRQSQATGSALSLFKGKSYACTIAFGKFKDCCGSGKGWGVSLNLSGCSGEERDLRDRSNRGLCIPIGTYCAQKILKVCVRKKRSSCCFPSKLSRLLHEQGRPQLGLSWGDPKTPDCRGLSVEELSGVRFDQLDLREIFQDIVSGIKTPSEDIVKRNLQARVAQMAEPFLNAKKGGQ